MSKKAAVTETVKSKKANLREAILLLEITMSEYKAERKAHWKSFKSKMNEDIEKVKKSANELPGKSKSKKS